MQEKQENLKTG